MELTLAEKIMYATMQIDMLDNQETTIGHATGFGFAFCTNIEEQKSIYALVTNRHVLEGCAKIRIVFTMIDSAGNPDNKDLETVLLDTSKTFFHPDPNVDLAVLLLSPTITEMQQRGKEPFLVCLDKSVIPTNEQWNSFDAIEDITMVGYPQGLRDTTNNLPIFRRGITATHPKFDYMGKPQFLMDMACFKGSSGSPVFVMNDGLCVDHRQNSVSFGKSIYLLGIQFAIPNIKEIGDVVIVPSEQTKAVSVTQSYINLGIAIKSTQLLAFEALFASIVKITNSLDLSK